MCLQRSGKGINCQLDFKSHLLVVAFLICFLLIIRWIEEIERKQAETVAVQIALEKLRQRNHLLTTENEMLKVRDVNNFFSTTPQQVVTILKITYALEIFSDGEHES